MAKLSAKGTVLLAVSAPTHIIPAPVSICSMCSSSMRIEEEALPLTSSSRACYLSCNDSGSLTHTNLYVCMLFVKRYAYEIYRYMYIYIFIFVYICIYIYISMFISVGVGSLCPRLSWCTCRRSASSVGSADFLLAVEEVLLLLLLLLLLGSWPCSTMHCWEPASSSQWSTQMRQNNDDRSSEMKSKEPCSVYLALSVLDSFW